MEAPLAGLLLGACTVVDLTLASAGCGGGGGGGRPLTADQQRVVDPWVERGLANADFTGGNVVAFLCQLFRLLA